MNIYTCNYNAVMLEMLVFVVKAKEKEKQVKNSWNDGESTIFHGGSIKLPLTTLIKLNILILGLLSTIYFLHFIWKRNCAISRGEGVW